jgi:hypothetical protein
MLHRCCFEGVLPFPGIASSLVWETVRHMGVGGSKNIQRSNNRPKKENCHDDLVPAFSFSGIGSPTINVGDRSLYGFWSSEKIE